MQNLHDIQEKIFFESKSILETLSKINSKEELLAKQDLFAEVTDRIAFLRILEKNKENFTTESTAQIIDNQELNLNFNNEILEENQFEEDVIEEEVIFTNELNDIENEKISDEETIAEISESEIQNQNVAQEEDFVSEHLVSENIIEENTGDFETKVPLIVEQEQSDYEDRIAQKEKEFRELEERRRKIVEFNKKDVVHPQKEEVLEEKSNEQQQAEKKFKLASIKGLKIVQNIFDDDPLEKSLEKESENTEMKSETGSLLKTNIPTDFMEAEMKKPEFKLDLNDKVAFTKQLFKGNDDELKFTIDKLNSFDNADDAKQYLSEIYYLKDWSKVDEYAQRLWTLVENKFL